jgi:alpha-tubulin suppressor-like RCC1 family protein
MRWFRGSVSSQVARLAPALAVLVGALSTATAQPAWASSPGAFGWGDNTRGQLGNGTTTASDIPVAMSGLSEVTAVSGGADFSLALLHDGTVMASGENGFGELGDGTGGGFSDVPVAVSGLSEVTAIAAGGNHSLALLRNGTVMAWGYNAFGQLGNGTETNSDVPVAVSGLSEVTAIAAGYNYSLALLRNGTVMAWGFNEFGVLGKGSSTESSNPTPAPVSGLSEVTAIAAGLDGVSTALLSNGTVMDWGYGGQGELGDGTETSSDVPVAVSGLTEVTALPHGGTSMALLRDGTVVDWGLGSNGRLGNGTGGGSSDVPVAVSGLTGVTAIAGGFEQRLALLGNGTVMAWGAGGSGQLGNGTTTGSEVPVAVSGLTGATAIGAGQYFSLAATGTSTAPPPRRPTVTNLSPDNGSTVGGTRVTVSGTGFGLGADATTFRFGSAVATKVECIATTQCTVVTPPHGARTVYVRALVNGAISADHLRGDRFTYVGA